MSTVELDTLLVVGEHLLLCRVPLSGIRLLDHLNDPRSNFLHVSESRLLHRPYDDEAEMVGDTIVSKARLRLAIPTTRDHEAPEKRFHTLRSTSHRPALVLLEEYELRGNVHLGPGADPAHALVYEFGQFIPITDATLSSRGKPMRFSKAHVVLANRDFVDAIHVENKPAASDLSELLEELTRNG
jgi:hypothetical protein